LWLYSQRRRCCRHSRMAPSRLVFKAHRRVYHSTLSWRVIKKKKYLVTGGDLVAVLPEEEVLPALADGPVQ